ncbi:MAG: diaminopimelate epimerase [Bacteroidota bacterium]
MSNIEFYKYQATGNDFVMLDDRKGEWAHRLKQEKIAFLCHRRFGIGADGLILLQTHPEYDFRMQYYNSDGRESSMCGNGGRCLVAFARDLGLIEHECHFEAIDGYHYATIQQNQVSLQMGKPTGYKRLAEGQYWIDTGSPHYVGFYEEPVASLPVVEEGRQIRNSAPFAPHGTNVNFVNVLNDRHLAVRTYERGVEDETYSCGTGVTACALVHLYQQQLTEGEILLDTPGGQLKVRQQVDQKVFLSGPAQRVFRGEMAESAISE